MTSNGVFLSDTETVPAVSATGENDADGVDASSTGGIGVSATSIEGPGILASSSNGPAGLIANTEGTGEGVIASSLQGIGLLAVSGGGPETPPAVQAAIVTQSLGSSSVGVLATTNNGAAVSASDQGSGTGVQASSDSGTAVLAQTGSGGVCMHAVGAGAAATPPTTIQGTVPTMYVEGISEGSAGVYVDGGSNWAVQTITGNGIGIHAEDLFNGVAVSGKSLTGFGVSGVCPDGTAVSGGSANGIGVAGGSPGGGIGVSATSGFVEATSQSNVAVFAQSQSGIGVRAVGGGASPAASAPITEGAILAEGGPGTGVYASSSSGIGVEASSASGSGVLGHSDTSTGVSGVTESGFGVTANGGSAGVALQVIGKVEVQGNSVGSVTMAAGTTTLKVNNAAATANSLIFLTPLEDPQAFLWIGARNAESFTIDTSKALPAKVTIAFLIIN